MGPFLYYQQALKPKERSVQQLKLDDQGKPLKDQSGPYIPKVLFHFFHFPHTKQQQLQGSTGI